MNNYELMVIFTPVLSEDDFKSAQKKYQDFIKENGGDTVASNPWGLKSLAYPIDKKTTGIYWVLEFTGPATINEKLKVQFLRDEQIMRHMITKLDKYAVEPTLIIELAILGLCTGFLAGLLGIGGGMVMVPFLT